MSDLKERVRQATRDELWNQVGAQSKPSQPQPPKDRTGDPL